MTSFKEAKMADLIAYMASRSHDDQHFGVVKAAKLLAFVDFAAYERCGEPITGARYLKLEHGPVPREFDSTLNLLKAKGQVRVQHRGFGRKRQKRIIATPAASWETLSAAELALADEFLERHRANTARDVRDLSHEMPGWALVTMRHEIPYHTTMITLAGPTAQDYADSAALAQRFGWT